MGNTVIPKKLRGWYYYLTSLSARNGNGTQLSKSSGVIQLGYSTSGAAYVSYGMKYNIFAGTVSLTSKPIPLGDIPNDIQSMLDDATKKRENDPEAANTPPQ